MAVLQLGLGDICAKTLPQGFCTNFYSVIILRISTSNISQTSFPDPKL